MTELTKILGKSYDNADFQNFLRETNKKSYEMLRKVSKINLRQSYEDRRNS